MGHRVKVYRLNEQGTWDDLGTGNVSLTVAEDPPEATSSLRVVVHAEVDPQRQLLFHRVESGVVYNRQGDDTIITWNDLFVKTDIALSFQEPSGCADVWREIQHAVAGLMGASMGAWARRWAVRLVPGTRVIRVTRG
jgi:protein phosphatase-4 regulatory subunit 3